MMEGLPDVRWKNTADRVEQAPRIQFPRILIDCSARRKPALRSAPPARRGFARVARAGNDRAGSLRTWLMLRLFRRLLGIPPARPWST